MPGSRLIRNLLRNDQKTYKDVGYYGPLDVPAGPGRPAGTATEFSVGTSDVNGQEMDIPTLVPGLTQQELHSMLTDIIPNRKPIPKSIMQKAVAHARMRVARGMSPFFNSELEGEPPLRPPMAGE